MIGCGDFYNQEREKVWCPWTQHPNLVDKYIVHVIGDPDAEADYTHLDDFANFLVATLLKPQKSENQYLNVVSDTISHAKIVELLRMYTGKEVQLDVQSVEAMHKVCDDPSKAPKRTYAERFPRRLLVSGQGTAGIGRACEAEESNS
ncbi:NAD-binding protein [Pyrenophora tritici-repentis]|uniref:NAD-binding protein n=1 Tax=Pyrenophora tritici-repentis TaxID=45151 RepID=A0A922NL18_9PLEO|nr:NAD-binding protein [Pyrenophora tritici-repentis]KAI1517851.1 NAD-binding protein [Pyrenophora tritici-repentis]KAI1689326.1 NAD-binding protein [Pyrenophora tritici-repentis]